MAVGLSGIYIMRMCNGFVRHHSARALQDELSKRQTLACVLATYIVAYAGRHWQRKAFDEA